MTGPRLGVWRLAWVVLLSAFVLTGIPYTGAQSGGDVSFPYLQVPCPSCPTNEAGTANVPCILSNCTLENGNTATEFSFSNLRSWLPETVRGSTTPGSSILLSGVVMWFPTCEPIWALQVQACTFQVSASWPVAGLQTGRAFAFLPFVTTNTTAIGGGVTTMQRVNFTCPLDLWASLESPSQPLPCGTTTVTSGTDLIAELNNLQRLYLRLLITLAANVTLPAVRSPVASYISPYTSPTAAAPDAAPSSATTTIAALDSDDDANPLVVLYRNVTLVGLSNRGGPGGGRQPTELNLVGRRNAFRLQQPTAVGSGAAFGEPPPAPQSAGSQQQATAAVGFTAGSSGIGGASGRVVLVMADLTLVKVPLGPADTWPWGLLASDMWHVGMDRNASAPVQLIHCRITLVLSSGQTKYFNYWYQMAVSLIEEDAEKGAWLLEKVTMTTQHMAPDGSTISKGITGSFLEKYNTSATSVPLLTQPDAPPVNLWAVEDPPVPLSAIGFVTSAADLAADLGRGWTTPRVVVLLGNISLDGGSWPEAGIQLATSATLAGPAAVSPDTDEQLQQLRYSLPVLNMWAKPFVKVPSGSRVSFRNMLVYNLSVAISWALPDAPGALPTVPGYTAWRNQCLPGYLANENGKYSMNGCLAGAPPEVFDLMRALNSPSCYGGSDSVVCNNSMTALGAAGYSCIPPALGKFFDIMFRASGQVPVTQPNNWTLFLRSHTMTGVLFNTTAFVRVPYPDSTPEASSSHLITCSLQTLLAMLANSSSSLTVQANDTNLLIGSAASTAKSSNTRQAAIIGGAVGGSVLFVVLGAAVACLAAPRLSSLPALPPPSMKAEALEKGPGDAESLSHPTSGTCTGGESTGFGHEEGRTLAGAVAYLHRTGTDGGPVTSSAPASSQGPASAAGLADGQMLAAGGARGADRAAVLQAPGMAAGRVMTVETDCCSAFSQSFALGDPACGKVPTMLEQLLRKPNVPEPQSELQRQAQPPLGPPPLCLAVARVLNVDLLAAGRAAEAGGGNGGRPNSLNHHVLLQNANANNANNNNINNFNNTTTSTMGTPTAASGSIGGSAHRALAGEIDGMIRRYEANPAGPNSTASQGTQRQKVLGSGGFGVVYKGEWRGLPVAIKVVLLQEGDSAERRERLVREVALSATLSHPNVVATYHYTVQPVAATAAAGSAMGPFVGTPPNRSPLRYAVDLPAPAAGAAPLGAGLVGPCGTEEMSAGEDDVRAYKLSIVMAYCDRGTLRDALKEGLFRKPWLPTAVATGYHCLALNGTYVTDMVGGIGSTGEGSFRPPSRSRSRRRGVGAGPVGGVMGTGGSGGGSGAAHGSSSGPAEMADEPGAAALGGVAVPHLPPSPPRPIRVLGQTHASPFIRTGAGSGPGPSQPHQGQGQGPGPSLGGLRLVPQRNLRAPAAAAAAGLQGFIGAEDGGDMMGLEATASEGADAGVGAGGAGGGAGSPRCLRSPACVEPSAMITEDVRLTWQDVRPAANQALALFAALDVARGLEYLHGCNVVHGDLSLQNILLTSSEPTFSDSLLNACGGASCSNSQGPMSAGAAGKSSTGATVAAPALLLQHQQQQQPVLSRLTHGMLHRLPEESASHTGSRTAGESGQVTLVSAAAVTGGVVSCAPTCAASQASSADVEASFHGGTLGGAIGVARTGGDGDDARAAHTVDAAGPAAPPPLPSPSPPLLVLPLPASLSLHSAGSAGSLHGGPDSRVPEAAGPAAAHVVVPAAATSNGSHCLGPATPETTSPGGARASAPEPGVHVTPAGTNPAAPLAPAGPTAAPGAGVVGRDGSAGGYTATTTSATAAVAVTVVRHSVVGASASTEGEAEAEPDPGPLAPTASTGTGTQSGNLWPLSLSLDVNTPAVSNGGGGGAFSGLGGIRPLSIARRLSAVQQLLSQVFKISDFGLSVRLEGDETHRSGMHQGTPYYTATEVLVSGKVSPAADVYSYGVCLWCLVHGVSLCQLRHLLPPFFTPVAPALLAHMSPELAPAVRSLVKRCLAGDPARRPTAAALVAELQGLVQLATGPEVAPLLLGAERRERDVGRTVAGLLLLDSMTSNHGGANG